MISLVDELARTPYKIYNKKYIYKPPKYFAKLLINLQFFFTSNLFE